MINLTQDFRIVDVISDNVSEAGICCIKDKKSPGFIAKVDWFRSKLNTGLKIKIALDKNNKQLGFIEFIPSELAWRPIKAINYIFIHCIAIYAKEARNLNVATELLTQCEKEAILEGKSGICVMSSDGPWMANRNLFEKNGYLISGKLDRYELLVKQFDNINPLPHFIDWTKQQSKYKGWNLIYSDQCPWHEKSVNDLKQSALENGINLKIVKLNTPKEAQNAPSGFGTFSLIKDGRLLGDHYLSRTRFENIIRKELKK